MHWNIHVYHPGLKRNALHSGAIARRRVVHVYIPLRTSHVGTRMDYDIIKLKHVYHPLNCVSLTIHVFVQLKPALSGQVLYLYIHNFTTYCINEYIHVHCSSVTKQISFAANHLYDSTTLPPASRTWLVSHVTPASHEHTAAR